MSEPSVLVWFRRDLRLGDNPALQAALDSGSHVIPVFIWSPEDDERWAPGSASRWWLHQSLRTLDADLRAHGSRLILRQGDTTQSLLKLVKDSGAESVFWNRLYEPASIACADETEKKLREHGIQTESFPGNLLWEPWTISHGKGDPFRVFTPFWNACLRTDEPAAPTAAPKSIAHPPKWPESVALADLKLEPTINWTGGIRDAWEPGEKGAHEQLRAFTSRHVGDYAEERDRPDHAGTSRISPHLHFGEVSSRQVWHAVKQGTVAKVYLREIGWREFAYHLLFHFPKTTNEALRADFARFPWRRSAKDLKAWTKGQTGYPLVDAGMRQLWHTGWMHNRVRMVVASFLVKHLLISWQEGAAWFWDTLVDADLANNTLGWQWVAGCGADAAPYFRIFNPVTQGDKFDPKGDYVRCWVPELAQMPAEWIQKPWQAPASVLNQAGVELGKSYPAPIVVHEEARARALGALASLQTGKTVKR